MLGRVLAAVLAVGSFALANGCASPTLPLPPPMAPSISTGSQPNTYKLTAPCGGVESGAIVVIENTALPGDQRVGGAVASACGSWDATIYANKGDVLNITQDDGTVVSSPVVVQIPQP
jgi:hypothetical protein